MTPLLRRSAWRYLRTHPWQAGLTILGVALAVAVVVGIDLANASAERAFRLSVEGVAGKATHEVVGGPAGLDEAIYVELRTSGLPIAQRSAPVIEGRGSVGRVDSDRASPGTDGTGADGTSADGTGGDVNSAPRRAVRLLGLDPFAEPPLRNFTAGLGLPGSSPSAAPVITREADPLASFLLEPGAVAMGVELAEELGVEPGDELRFEGPAGPKTAHLMAVLQPIDPLAKASSRDLLIADLATAQELLGKIGVLDRIDLIADNPEKTSGEGGLGLGGDGSEDSKRELEEQGELGQLASRLPAGVVLRSKAARAGTLDQMTRAFRLNLSALSLLALLVGMFLVYNTATFAVVQRRPLLGRLRAMGVTRREIFSLIIWEAAALGAIGTGLGLLAGLLLSQGLLGLVSQTINDLYFALDVRRVSLEPASLIKGLVLGLGGPVLAAMVPAAEATRTAPRVALQRSTLEAKSRRFLPWSAAGGLVLGVLSAVLLTLPSRALPLAFGGIFLFVVAFACWVPVAVFLASRMTAPLAARLIGGLGRLAIRGVEGTLSRTGVAVAALVIAIATTLGVGVMVSSFRATLVQWLEGTLQADIYITAALQDARGVGQPLENAWIETVREAPGVGSVSTYRRTEVAADPVLAGTSSRGTDSRGIASADSKESEANGGDVEWIPTQLHAIDMQERAFASFQWAKTPAFPGAGESDILASDSTYRRFRAGEGVLISEPYAYRHDLAPGDSLRLIGDDGPRSFEVLAVFYDYASDRGLVMIDRALYDRHWNDPSIHSLGVFLEADAQLGPTLEHLRTQLPADRLSILANRELRQASLAIFDRTFRITSVLRLLAVGVAFLGMLSALMALQLERAHELGVLRANGMTPAQVWGLVTAQTGFLGLIAGLMALPLGWVLAALLIQVINKRSFGWTLVMETPPEMLLQTVLLALAAALLAGLYPARKMARTSPAMALRGGSAR